MSGSHSHHSHQQLHSPDPNHLITEHLHLSPLIKSTISTHSFRTVTVWSQTLYVDLSDSHLPLSTYQLFLFSGPRSPPLLCSSVSPLCRMFWIPWKRKKDCLQSDKTQETLQLQSTHLNTLPCLISHLPLFNKPAVGFTYLRVPCLSADNVLLITFINIK